MIYNIQYHLMQDLASEPIDISYFKKHARIDFNTDDELLQDSIVAARQELEEWSGLSFGEKTWRLTADYVPNRYKLSHGPIASIIEDEYVLLGDTVSSNVLVDNHIANVDLTFTTKPLHETKFSYVAKIAVARYAAGLYAIREHIVTDDKGNPINGQNLVNEAQESLRKFKEVVLC